MTHPSEAELRALCADLLENWYSTLAGADGQLSLGRSDQDADPIRFTTVFAFAAHSHELVSTACQLLHRADYASAVPLLRVAYESAITATWAADSTEAAKALELELLRGVKNLRKGLVETGWFESALEEIPEPTERLAKADVTKDAIEQTRWFNKMCDALEPEPAWLYQQFRLLSAYAHPSGSVIEMFVPGDGDVLYARPAHANEHAYLAWWFAAATTLLYAGQALDRLDRSASRTEILQAAGVMLGSEVPLQLRAEIRAGLESEA